MLCHFDFQLCNLLIGHIGKRQAAVAAVEAHQVQCLLYRDWVDVHEQCVHEVEILKREWITPVPGGVGPMTIAMLMYNCVEAVRLQKTER